MFPDAAYFSDDEIHRWWLTRELGGDRPLVCCGLNPSTATAIKNDQTIGKDIGFARRWNCGRVIKVNAYGYRATDPNAMKRARKSGVNVVGTTNDWWLRKAFETAVANDGIIMVGWGNHIEPTRQLAIAALISSVPGAVAMCLGTNSNGTPKHELYIPYECPLIEWRCPIGA